MVFLLSPTSFCMFAVEKLYILVFFYRYTRKLTENNHNLDNKMGCIQLSLNFNKIQDEQQLHTDLLNIVFSFAAFSIPAWLSRMLFNLRFFVS